MLMLSVAILLAGALTGSLYGQQVLDSSHPGLSGGPPNSSLSKNIRTVPHPGIPGMRVEADAVNSSGSEKAATAADEYGDQITNTGVGKWYTDYSPDGLFHYICPG